MPKPARQAPTPSRLSCPVPKCNRTFHRQPRVNTHLRDVHRVPLTVQRGGNMDELRQTQNREFRDWCGGKGHPDDIRLHSDVDYGSDEEDGGGVDEDGEEGELEAAEEGDPETEEGDPETEEGDPETAGEGEPETVEDGNGSDTTVVDAGDEDGDGTDEEDGVGRYPVSGPKTERQAQKGLGRLLDAHERSEKNKRKR